MMTKYFVDLGVRTVGVIECHESNVPQYSLNLLEGASIDDGAYSPPQHIWVGAASLRNLYAALHGIYKDEGDED